MATELAAVRLEVFDSFLAQLLRRHCHLQAGQVHGGEDGRKLAVPIARDCDPAHAFRCQNLVEV